MNALIINLAVSDFLNGLLAGPLYSVPHYMLPSALSDPVVCVLTFVARQYSFAVTMLTTFAIATERYVAVLHPFWEAPKCCAVFGTIPFLVATTWLCPAFLIAGLTTYGVYGKTWDKCDQSLIFTVVHHPILAGHLFLILCLCSFFYAKIMVGVRRSRKAVTMVTKQSTNPEPGNEPQTNRKTSHRVSAVSSSSQELNVVKTLLILMILFYVCFVPIGMKMLVRFSIGMQAPQPAWLLNFEQFGITFAMLSSCLDPIVYGWRNRKLRHTIRDMFKCRTREAVNHDLTHNNWTQHRQTYF